MTQFQKIHIIINPASGITRPIIRPLNALLKATQLSWRISVTTQAGDAYRFAMTALEEKSEVVAVFGGDGTVGEVASTLVGEETPLLILPGGSGNVVSAELGSPINFVRCLKLFCQGKVKERVIDVGRVGDKYFLLRISSGLEAEIVRATEQTLKSRVGVLAYALSGFKAVLKTKPTHYTFNLDGKKVLFEGLSYIIANSGNLGLPGIGLSPKIKVDDGLLDVLVIRAADIRQLFSIDFDSSPQKIIAEFFQHWQVKKVRVDSKPNQFLHCDGEMFEGSSVSAEVIPKALKILVPKRLSF